MNDVDYILYSKFNVSRPLNIPYNILFSYHVFSVFDFYRYGGGGHFSAGETIFHVNLCDLKSNPNLQCVSTPMRERIHAATEKAWELHANTIMENLEDNTRVATGLIPPLNWENATWESALLLTCPPIQKRDTANLFFQVSLCNIICFIYAYKTL